MPAFAVMTDSHGKTTARLTREKRTIQAMVRVYCRAHHATRGTLCAECQSLLAYALGRLDRCPHGAEENPRPLPDPLLQGGDEVQIKAVMRYAGPRMMFRHPILALFHLLDAFRADS